MSKKKKTKKATRKQKSKTKKITKKRVLKTKLKNKTVEELLTEMKTVKKQISKSSTPVKKSIRDMEKVVHTIGIAEDRLKIFRENIKKVMLDTVTDAEKNADKLNPQFFEDIKKVKEILSKK